MNYTYVDKEASYRWLMNGKLFSETEEFMPAIQGKKISTNNYKKKHNEGQIQEIALKNEIIQHITSKKTLG